MGTKVRSVGTVLVYVYANQIAAQHQQINYKSKLGCRAKLKINSRYALSDEGANGHPSPDLVGVVGV